MVNKFFNYKELSAEKQEETNSGAYVSKYLATHFEKVANLEDDLTRLPTPGEFFFLQSGSAFNAFTFIPMIARRFPVKELFASTYSINRRVIDALMELHDKGVIEQVTLLVSESMIKRNPVTIDNLHAMAATRPNVKVYYAWSHAKICLLKTQDFHFVIEGSGNWSENAYFEQYLLANDEGLYNFRKLLFEDPKLKKY